MQKHTELLRQIHPTHVKGDVVSQLAFEISSSSFLPNDNDHGYLSVYNTAYFGPAEAHRHYTEVIRNKSVGVLAVTKSECDEENLKVIEDNLPFEGHASIDYNGLSSKGAQKRAASNLRDKAVAKGWRHLG